MPFALYIQRRTARARAREVVWVSSSLYAILNCSASALFHLCCVCGNLLLFIMTSRDSTTSSGGGALKKRRAITREMKLDIVKRIEKGETATSIGRFFRLSRSTVATIIMDKDHILEHLKTSAPKKCTVVTNY